MAGIAPVDVVEVDLLWKDTGGPVRTSDILDSPVFQPVLPEIFAIQDVNGAAGHKKIVMEKEAWRKIRKEIGPTLVTINGRQGTLICKKDPPTRTRLYSVFLSLAEVSFEHYDGFNRMLAEVETDISEAIKKNMEECDMEDLQVSKVLIQGIFTGCIALFRSSSQPKKISSTLDGLKIKGITVRCTLAFEAQTGRKVSFIINDPSAQRRSARGKKSPCAAESVVAKDTLSMDDKSDDSGDSWLQCDSEDERPFQLVSSRKKKKSVAKKQHQVTAPDETTKSASSKSVNGSNPPSPKQVSSGAPLSCAAQMTPPTLVQHKQALQADAIQKSPLQQSLERAAARQSWADSEGSIDDSEMADGTLLKDYMEAFERGKRNQAAADPAEQLTKADNPIDNTPMPAEKKAEKGPRTSQASRLLLSAMRNRIASSGTITRSKAAATAAPAFPDTGMRQSKRL